MAALTRPDNLASIYNERTELDALEKKRRRNMLLGHQSLIAVDSSKAIRISANAGIGMRSDSKPKRIIDISELKEMSLKPYQDTGKVMANADLDELSKDLDPVFNDEVRKNFSNTQEINRGPLPKVPSR